MKSTIVNALRAFVFIMVLVISFNVHAGEIGHFAGGLMNIRDYIMPDPGLYGVVYNYFYNTNRLNDPNGDKVNSIATPSGAKNVDVNVSMYALAPTLLWVTDIESLGIKYGALISPSFVNTNLNADFSIAMKRGGDVNAGSFGMGDLFVQPVWLGKSLQHWDFALSYGFYAPIGKYDTSTATLPVIGPVTTESSDNLGFGFWTNQIQGSMSWYPMDNKGTAIVTALTYEINGKKNDFELTPGDNLTLNWGISQFVPLKADNNLLLEVGLVGYDTWQVTTDTGSDANSNRDEVHAIGAQLGVTHIPWGMSLNLHGFSEYAAKERFQGNSLGISIAKKF